MTILPTKRGSSAEESGESSTQGTNKDRSSRHRDDHSISHNVALLNDSPGCSTRRNQFSYGSPGGDRKDRNYRKRYKETAMDRPRDREREREQMRDLRREHKRDRIAKREIISPDVVLENNASTSNPEPVLPEASSSLCNDAGNKIEGDNNGHGCNSEDEYETGQVNVIEQTRTNEEWAIRDDYFNRCLRSLGFEIKLMNEDGACLFRAIADQVYGDQELHFTVRSQCMDYIVKNKDFFAAYVTEDFDKYVGRKKRWNVHGNHLEIQALSEMYNRTIEVYCYHTEPINIFNGSRINTYEPIRVSYHRMCHYNSITNPNNPSILVGLGLPNCFTRYDMDSRNELVAVQKSEELLIEQTMLEDKIKATDWEATNEAIEEQVARESYIQFFRDAERRLQGTHSTAAGSSSTFCSGIGHSSRSGSRRGSVSPKGGMSPKGSSSPKLTQVASSRTPPRAPAQSSPLAIQYPVEVKPEVVYSSPLEHVECTKDQVYTAYSNGCSSADAGSTTSMPSSSGNFNAGGNYQEDWDEPIMAQMLAESQLTYFADLKRIAMKRNGSPEPSTSR